MKTREVTNNRGETFKLTEDEERYYRALKRLEKMNSGRLCLFGSGRLSVRINDCWNGDEVEILNIFCEGGDGGEDIMKEETGIDLSKLEAVLDAALANETEESLTEFLNEMRKNEKDNNKVPRQH